MQEEDYTDFGFSRGWVNVFKARYSFARIKLRGEDGEYDERLLLTEWDLLPNITGDYTLLDIFNNHYKTILPMLQLLHY